MIANSQLSAFDFDIVNFPDLSGNIPTAQAYGTYISQLIRYSRIRPYLWQLFFSTFHASRKTFQLSFFCEKTDENILQTYR